MSKRKKEAILQYMSYLFGLFVLMIFLGTRPEGSEDRFIDKAVRHIKTVPGTVLERTPYGARVYPGAEED